MAVLTAQDMKAAKVTNTARHVAIANLVLPLRPPLAEDRVLHVGQPVAAVIAKTARQAHDAAELIAVDYDVLPSVVDPRAAVKPDAPQLWPEAPGNLAVDWPGRPPIRRPMLPRSSAFSRAPRMWRASASSTSG